MSEVRITDAKAEEELAAAFAIRREVFCDEQGVSEHEELDGLDSASRHYLVWRSGSPIGTARVRRLSDNAFKVERVAIRRFGRGNGLGRTLMLRIIDDIAQAGGAKVVLNAQLAVREFYAGLGFESEGEVFEEAGIPHIKMTQVLNRSTAGATITDS